MKSIRSIIVTCIVLLTLVLSGIFFALSNKFANYTLERTLEYTLGNLARTVASEVTEQNEKQFKTLRSLASLPYIKDFFSDLATFLNDKRTLMPLLTTILPSSDLASRTTREIHSRKKSTR